MSGRSLVLPLGESGIPQSNKRRFPEPPHPHSRVLVQPTTKKWPSIGSFCHWFSRPPKRPLRKDNILLMMAGRRLIDVKSGALLGPTARLCLAEWLKSEETFAIPPVVIHVALHGIVEDVNAFFPEISLASEWGNVVHFLSPTNLRSRRYSLFSPK
ncbi:hypothetical protein XU18_0585 [Perkinsela sp. CCAP 1560/4]|nr:hypothetical protein XU18_4340 [Perkinsela sp. CCAP 1560/4]KNH09165.1 hypothetical protein XU18_0585 [Perkinsela sp. CCAP 1560/4]|eukprot:KNH04373.1 hypothetical protein XU18_4340 [Perkinsela sp. CCAP 1560/4]